MGPFFHLPSPIPFHEIVFIIIHSTVDGIAIIENIILLLALVFRSPSNLRSYAVLLMYTTSIDLAAALSSGLLMIRLIPVNSMVAFVYDGPCVAISNFFCHCMFCVTLATLSQSALFVAVSFGYRFYVLEQHAPSRRQVLLVCVLFTTPAFIFVTPYIFALDDTDAVRIALFEAMPDFPIGYEIEGHLSVYQFEVAFVILGESLPALPTLIAVVVIRAKVLAKLRDKSEKMSVKTMKLHRAFTKVLSIQATMPAFFLFGVTNFYLCHSGLACAPVQQHFIVNAGSFIPLLSPAVTLYYVQPYRAFLADIIFCNRIKRKRSSVSETAPNTII